MELIDTHAHLYDEQYDADRDATIERARQHGLTRIYMACCDIDSYEPMRRLEEDYPGVCYSMAGIHPCYIKGDYRAQIDYTARMLQERSFAAVGEIGLDYHWDKSHIPQQKAAFREQLELARRHHLPVVIHSRESTEDCIAILQEYPDVNGIFHCFSGDTEQAQRLISMGYMIGIGGVVTFKKSSLQQVVRDIPLASIVLETDAPYLAPTPHRGKRNECAYVPLIAQQVADLKEVSLEEVARVTTANALRIFRHAE